MSSPYSTLVSILSRELDLFRKMKALLFEERRALSRLETDRLLALANEKDCLALQLKALEEARRMAIESAVEESGGGLDPERARISDVADMAPGAEGAALRRLGEDLLEVVEEGLSANSKIGILSERSLELVREAMHALAQPERPRQTYLPGGAMRAYKSAPLVMANQA